MTKRNHEPDDEFVDPKIAGVARRYSRVFGSADGIVTHLATTELEAIRHELRGAVVQAQEALPGLGKVDTSALSGLGKLDTKAVSGLGKLDTKAVSGLGKLDTTALSGLGKLDTKALSGLGKIDSKALTGLGKIDTNGLPGLRRAKGSPESAATRLSRLVRSRRQP